jgi:hypothetical protein
LPGPLLPCTAPNLSRGPWLWGAQGWACGLALAGLGPPAAASGASAALLGAGGRLAGSGQRQRAQGPCLGR